MFTLYELDSTLAEFQFNVFINTWISRFHNHIYYVQLGAPQLLINFTIQIV